MKRALTLWSEGHLTIAKCQEEDEKKIRKRKTATVQDKVKVAPNRRGKETKAFVTFSAGRWKNDTTTFLKSIESEIGRAEMNEIMEEARQVRSSASQAHEESAIVFENLDDVPDEMIVRNGYGEPESSGEEWVPTHADTGNVVYPCLFCTMLLSFPLGRRSSYQSCSPLAPTRVYGQPNRPGHSGHLHSLDHPRSLYPPHQAGPSRSSRHFGA